MSYNPILYSNNIQDIKIKPGVVLNENSQKYLTNNVITTISPNKHNLININFDAIQLSPIPYSSDEDFLRDLWDIDTYNHIGSLVTLNQYDNNSTLNDSFEIFDAVVCDSKGLIDISKKAECLPSKFEDNIIFAKKSIIGKQILINVILPNSTISQSLIQIRQGQKILVLSKNGYNYFYGILPDDINIKDKYYDKEKDIIKLDNLSILSLDSYSSNKEYIYSLLKKGGRYLENAIIILSYKENDASLHEKYKKNWKQEMDNLCDDYQNKYNLLKKSLNNLEINFFNSKNLFNSFNNSVIKYPASIEDTINKKKDYEDICKKLWDKTVLIVKELDINFIDESSKTIKNKLYIHNDKDICITSKDGILELNANKIILRANNKILLSSPDVLFSSNNQVNTQVGFSQINVKSDKTEISTGSTCLGKNDNNDGLLASSFSVSTFNGISGSAYQVKLTGRNGLSINGPFNTGISLGYGTVKLVCSEFKLQTQTRAEQAVNLSNEAIKYLTDVIYTAASIKKGSIYKTINQGADDLKWLFYKLKNFKSTVKDVKESFNLALDSDRTVLDSKSNEERKLTTGEKFWAYFDFIDKIVKLLFLIADSVISVLKKIYKYKKFYSKESESETETKEIYLTPNDSTSKIDQAEMYVSYIKLGWSILVASFKVIQGDPRSFSDTCSKFSVNSAKIGFDSPKLATTTDIEKVESISQVGALYREIERNAGTVTQPNNADHS